MDFDDGNIDDHLFAFTLLLMILAFCIFFICCSKHDNQNNNSPTSNSPTLPSPKPLNSTFHSDNPPGYDAVTKTSKTANDSSSENKNSCSCSYSPPHTPLPDYSIAIKDDSPTDRIV